MANIKIKGINAVNPDPVPVPSAAHANVSKSVTSVPVYLFQELHLELDERIVMDGVTYSSHQLNVKIDIMYGV